MYIDENMDVRDAANEAVRDLKGASNILFALSVSMGKGEFIDSESLHYVSDCLDMTREMLEMAIKNNRQEEC